MSESTPEFEDANLKLAVRRAAGGTKPNADLRAAVADLIRRETRGEGDDADEQDVPRVIARTGLRGGAARWFALAAALVLAVGGAALLLHRHHRLAEDAEYLAANRPLFDAMIRAQCDPAGRAAAAADLPVDDRDGLRKLLAQRLRRPVPVPDWAGKGWRLAAASVGSIANHRCAELCYENGGRKILFVSLPADAYSGHEGEEPEPYQYSVDGHPVAGFVRDGGLHCIIGAPDVPLSEVADLKVD